MIKAAFFDVDGTLLSLETHEMPQSAREALQGLRDNGIKVFVSTGRHPLMLEAVRELFDFDGYITLNGQIAFDKEDILRKSPIPTEIVKQLVDRIEGEELTCMVLEEDYVYGNRVSELITETMFKLGLPTPQIMSMERTKKHAVYQVIAFVSEEYEAPLCRPLAGVEFVRWNQYFLDVVPDDGGKHRGIQAVMEKYGFTQEEVIAFGDGDNDKTMLGFAGIGVAMGGAAEDVRAAANYVTDTVDENGIANGLKHFGLI
ncbi:MAG: Cof-type HAD-IIB family hydrolase [Eubacteriales bacterium]